MRPVSHFVDLINCNYLRTIVLNLSRVSCLCFFRKHTCVVFEKLEPFSVFPVLSPINPDAIGIENGCSRNSIGTAGVLPFSSARAVFR
jgi:hypothetical protein